ncbi:MAG TPA: hypothetical protein VFZ22_04520 [Pyrinomonadaceae bacterium]|nr:hypothetical protein [Pyrinomonadaceae bacterium]
MKRIIGSFAALALALSVGAAAYGKATPRQNQNNSGQMAPAKTTHKKKTSKKKKRNTGHHKGHTKKAAAKSSPTPKK